MIYTNTKILKSCHNLYFHFFPSLTNHFQKYEFSRICTSQCDNKNRVRAECEGNRSLVTNSVFLSFRCIRNFNFLFFLPSNLWHFLDNFYPSIYLCAHTLLAGTAEFQMKILLVSFFLPRLVDSMNKIFIKTFHFKFDRALHMYVLKSSICKKNKKFSTHLLSPRYPQPLP